MPDNSILDASVDQSSGRMAPEGITLMAQLFVLLNTPSTTKDLFRYVHGAGWHIWDGKRWAESDEAEAPARRRLVEVLGIVGGFAAKRSVEDGKRYYAAVSQCHRTASAQQAVLKLVACWDGVSTPASALDADPWALNVANGVLNLKDGTLHPHSHEGPIHTRLTRAAFNPDTDTTEWETWLQERVPSAETRRYLRQTIGLALVGLAREEFIIAHGPAAGGKNTFAEAVEWAIGDYARPVEVSLFQQHKFAKDADAATPALFALKGIRFAYSEEPSQGYELSDGTVKRLTSGVGASINARKLHSQQETFTMTHSLMMLTNTLPKISHGMDSGLARRIHVVPFTVPVPKAVRRPEFKDEFKKRVPDQVLVWAVAGLMDYLTNGRYIAPDVAAATQQYETESDDMRNFIQECTAPAPDKFVKRTDVWREWCEYTGAGLKDRLGQQEFIARFGELYKKATLDGFPGFRGVRLLSAAEEEAEILNLDAPNDLPPNNH